MLENWEYWFLAVLIAVVFLSFVKEWISVEIVALVGMFLCVGVGILPLTEALSVFSHPSPARDRLYVHRECRPRANRRH